MKEETAGDVGIGGLVPAGSEEAEHAHTEADVATAVEEDVCADAGQQHLRRPDVLPAIPDADERADDVSFFSLSSTEAGIGK